MNAKLKTFKLVNKLYDENINQLHDFLVLSVT